MLVIYFIRHAESVANTTPHLITGRSNHSPLSDDGVIQAHALGQQFLEDGIVFDKVYASPAVRAVSTAEIVGGYLGFSLDDIAQYDALQELDQGDWVGKERVKIYTPEVLKEMNSNNWQYFPPNGESQKEVEDRMYGWLEENLLHTKGKVAVFGHGMAIKCLYRKLTGSDPSETYKIKLDNTGIARFTYDGEWVLTCMNDKKHVE